MEIEELFEKNLEEIKENSENLNEFNLSFIKKENLSNINFQDYEALKSLDPVSLEKWKFISKKIEKDLKYLLSLPLRNFWCQVVLDKSLNRSINSFLQNIDRDFDSGEEKPQTDEDEVVNLKTSLSKLYFFVLLRMSTRKENKENQIDENLFGKIIYENNLFDIPKLLDICSIYGKNNRELVTKMLKNILESNKNYEKDFKILPMSLLKSFQSIYSRCNVKNSQILLKINEKQKNFTQFTNSEFSDVIFFISDIFNTLNLLISLHPPSFQIFSNPDFILNLIEFYETISDLFLEELKKRKLKKNKINKIFTKTRHNILKFFRSILNESTLAKLSKDSKYDEENVENYLLILTSLLENKRFLADYFFIFPLEEDIKKIKNSTYQVDKLRFQYINNAITQSFNYYSTHRFKSEISQKDIENKNKQNYSETVNNYHTNDNPVACSSNHGNHETNNEQIDMQMMLKITSIQELFPHYGSLFLKKCLLFYEMDEEKVICNLLESSLPEELEKLDRKLNLNQQEFYINNDEKKKEEEEEEEEKEEDGGIMEKRKNIFDNDEFDLINNYNNVDKNKIIIKKKNKFNDINNKNDILSMKERYHIYDNEFKEGSYYANEEEEARLNYANKTNEYDDEYDDGYDGDEVGKGDEDSADEMIQKINNKNIINNKINNNYDNNLNYKFNQNKFNQENEEEKEEEEEKRNKKGGNFIEDPAKLREMAAERRAQKYQRYNNQSEKKTYDVTGRTKGQGQNSEVTKNRTYKEKQKGSRANHNRKNMADRKYKI